MNEQEASKVFSLELLTLVKKAQNQNGLRHNDFGRYHQYCQRKLYR
jgi:signal recognition particle subunit SRP68